ncbi:adenosine deaminase 2-like [Vanessa cardui]|uniref:adenosine deaminase 2-like n=1 Tax=Vanessa cardui TaxID=171605 RepID=UPI001F129400|nr:adenosine deaminase 2-like [Vanessa cardui]
MWTVIVWPLLCLTSAVFADNVFEKNIKERNYLLKKELDMMLGNDIDLSDSEEQANKVIMKLKNNELDYGFNNPQYFNYSKHFFEYKDDIKKSELFKIIKNMPKGAVLHAHDTGILSPDYVLSLTYWDDLFVCFEEENILFLFSLDKPKSPCKTVWQLMKHARYSSGNVEKFDAELRKHFTLVIKDPNRVYTDINVVWSKFQQYFIKTSPLFCYKPVWEQYFYDTLKALRDDNVMYLEIRSVLPTLYDLDGNEYDAIDTAASYKKVLDTFLEDYPDFFGAKLIYAPLRFVDSKTVKDYLKIAKKLKKKFPDFLAGFDLVGQEDLGVPTKEFLQVLSEASDDFDYFFHAGETNWYGTSSDENLVDAIVLEARRIGHAFAIVKHPVLMEEAKERDIAMEVNVVSNTVLKLVEDIRNHPLAVFLSKNLPVVISSDDPGLWEADPLSHDYYITFVGVASRHADIKLLKKLALNSLYYSTYPHKDKLIHEFEIRWTKFIDTIVQDQYF